MSVPSVDVLSDEDTLLLSPKAERKKKDVSLEDVKATRENTKGHGKAKGRGKGKGKGQIKEVSGKSAPPKSEKPAKKPAKKTAKTPMKRPAAAPASAPASAAEPPEGSDSEDKAKPPADPEESAMKKPAAASKRSKKALGFSVGKSLYKRDGVWSVKLNQKEVIRVPKSIQILNHCVRCF